jgi:hypothetical protein
MSRGSGFYGWRLVAAAFVVAVFGGLTKLSFADLDPGRCGRTMLPCKQSPVEKSTAPGRLPVGLALRATPTPNYDPLREHDLLLGYVALRIG